GAMLASTAVGLDEGGLAASLSLALGGDAEGMRRLVAGLMPIVQARVTRGLWRHQRRTGARRDPGQETDDLVQEVFAALFAGGAKTLRAWDPSRGLSLANFVGLVAEHEVSARLRNGRRSPWREEPMLEEELVGAAGVGHALDLDLISRDLLITLF